MQQPLYKLPWFHLCTLHDKVKDPAEREWSARAALEHGWSRNVLAMQVETGLYHRQGAAVTNFERTLPAPQSDLAQQTIKDPYNFDFLTLSDDTHEREVEGGLVTYMRDCLLELGVGFSFVGSQYPLSVDDEDHFIDLLYFHLKLRCYVVIELKAGAFQPEHVGKRNFYLGAVNDLLCHPDDQPSIGIILCRGKKKRASIEYSLQGMTTPMSVSEFQLSEALPEELKGQLPTIEDLEAELQAPENDSEQRAHPSQTQASSHLIGRNL